MNPEAKKIYDDLKKQSLDEICAHRALLDSAVTESRLCELVYEEKLIERKHDLDLKLLREQSEIIKSSNRVIAIATISAALLGAIVGAVLQYKLTQKPEAATTQKVVPSSSLPPK